MPRQGSYVNNAQNRALGRVGMSYGSAVHSSSGSSYSSSSYGGGSSGYSGTYVDNSMNRSLGRVGMTHGTAVHSSGSSYSSSGYGGGSSGSSGTYVDNSMNRSLGRVGMTHGTAVHSSGSSYSGSGSTSSSRTYVDNPMNRSLGRVGLELGTAIHSKSSSSRGSNSNTDGGYSSKSSSTNVYVDNAMNRSLGRVGLPLGSAVHSTSRSSDAIVIAAPPSGKDGASRRCYVDNAYNRRLGRAGKPLGTAVQSSKSLTSASSAGPRRYVDNPMNRRLGRVGKIVGTAPVTKGNMSRELHYHEDNNDDDDCNMAYRQLRRLDPEDDDLDEILNYIAKCQELCQDNPEAKAQCEKAKGIVYRHEATRTLYEAGLKKPEWLKGGEIIDFADLELGEKLGNGGFGDVFAAIWKGNLQVAVKKLRVQRVSQSKKENFLKEVKVFSSLRHPGIVEFYGACDVTPNLAIVMEFMERGSLHDVLHVEEQKLSQQQKYQMIADMLSALAYIHDKKFAHRDMKSMNVLVCEDFEHCKIGDFGCTLKDDTRSSSSVADFGAVGTLRYSPPEVLEGERLTFEDLKCADVYSTSIVIVELLTAKEPFDGLNQHQVRKAILKGERPAFKSKQGGNVEPELQRLLEKGFHKHPKERPSASLMLHTFQDITLD